MSRLNPEIEHLLRRAGFGASAADVETYRDMSTSAAIAHLVDYEGRPDDVDARIGRPDHAQVTSKDLFAPDIDIDDARQRWMFRMIHSRRPLQEKMALFWHNHFATAYSKLAADSGNLQAAKMLAHKPGVLRGPQGQLELASGARRKFARGLRGFFEIALGVISGEARFYHVRLASGPASWAWRHLNCSRQPTF